MIHPTEFTVEVENGLANFRTFTDRHAQLVVINTSPTQSAYHGGRLSQTMQHFCEQEIDYQRATFQALHKELLKVLDDTGTDADVHTEIDYNQDRRWNATPAEIVVNGGNYTVSVQTEFKSGEVATGAAAAAMLKGIFDCREKELQQIYRKILEGAQAQGNTN